MQTAYQDRFAEQHLPPREQWPELVFDTNLPVYPEQLNCAAALLDHVQDPQAIALHSAQGTWTYAQLAARVNQIAHVLRDEMGLVPGNRVLLRGANNPQMAACVLAVWKAGLIAVPTMPLLRAKELATIIDLAQVNAVLCAQALQEEMHLACQAKPLPTLYFNCSTETAAGQNLDLLLKDKSSEFAACPTSAEDVCLLSFTSGTTGKPKGTMHFHRDVLVICDCFPRSILQVQASDIFIGTPPLAFTFGLGGLLLFPLRYGASTVLLEKLTPEALLQAIANYRATLVFTAPTFYRQMTPLVGKYDISSLRESISAGEALPLETRSRWQQASSLNMVDGIGATEMLHIFISAAGADIRPGATGKPIPGYQACILDNEGRTLGPGVTGRLAVKGPTGCRYLNDPRQRDYVCNGWNITGDAYEMDEEGYFHFRARNDDMIISAGYNIAGPEVEDVLLQHPQVAECAVIGCPDQERGQVVTAFVVLREGAAGGAEMEKELQDFFKQHAAPYKYPRKVVFKSALPRTETGKLQRFKLRQELSQA